ncbi:MAG: TRAP transporter small permease, partial [Pseudomonadota bacterium]
TTNVGAFTLDRVAALWGSDVSGLPGYEDFVRLTISSAALMFFPYCQLMRGHVAVELFVDNAPSWFKRSLEVLWLGCTVLAALFFAYWMWIGMFETRSDGAVSRVLGWSEWPFYLPGIVSLILWAAVALCQIFTPGGPAGEPDHG